jgi:hypothetical protein
MERMMTAEGFWSLVRQTLVAPRDAAARLLSLGLPAREGWLALAVMAVLNTLVYSLSLRLSPPTDPAMMGMMAGAFNAPLIFAIFLFGALALTALVFTHAGRALGGVGTVGGMLVLLAWMQALRLMVQLGLLVLALIAPPLAGIVVIVAGLWGLYILMAFMAELHGFDSLWRAAGVIIIALVALVFGLRLLLRLLGFGVV